MAVVGYDTEDFDIKFLNTLERQAEATESLVKAVDFFTEKLLFQEKGLLVTLNKETH